MKRQTLLLSLLLLFSAAALSHGNVDDSHPEKAAAGAVNYEYAEVCSNEDQEWRNATTIDGVKISESERCSPDNPYTVAASVKGTNRISKETLMKSGLSRDAVVKKNDTDGDGDSDSITISLEIMGINEYNQSNIDYAIAPGIKPAFWVFAPETRGMVEDGSTASDLIRMPSPTLRVEEGDNVTIKLHNTHYMPHTLHLHGVDHPFNSSGRGNDGVPGISEKPLPPGETRSYEFSPREEGTMFYHCHVVPNVHVAMGLNGMFKIEEEKDNNTVQTLNIGAGEVRHPGTAGNFSGEYDMVYQSIDRKLHQIPQKYDDTRRVSRQIHRKYDITDTSADYFLFNGKSFPYTLRDSSLNVEKNKRYQLNVLNVGRGTVSLHTHGHKFKKVAVDGVELENAVQRDVLSLSPAQRATLILNTTNDGLNSYGEGAWILHDHREEAVTTNGIGMGGTVGAILYEDYRKENGMPRTAQNLTKYFTEAYYEGKIPFFRGLDRKMFGEVPGENITRVLELQTVGSGDMPMMEMQMKEGGLVVNSNQKKLPQGCKEVSGEKTVKVGAGEKFASPGNAFSYSRKNYSFDTCQRVTIVLNNTDEVRHQWMLHGLPQKTYPRGMFTIEADGGEVVNGTFITPAEPQQLNFHCSLPQHQQKGMHGKIRIDEPETQSSSKDSILSFLFKLL